MRTDKSSLCMAAALAMGVVFAVTGWVQAQSVGETAPQTRGRSPLAHVTQAEREAAADRIAAVRAAAKAQAPAPAAVAGGEAAAPMAMEMPVMPGPGDTPHYFGPEPNWAFSPALRKFVDRLPQLGPDGANALGQYIPVAVPDIDTYPGSDYYEIEVREYSKQLHSDLPLTRLRGYVQVRNGQDVAPIQYLGPLIMAERDRPVRIKFTNKLPVGDAGNLFIPVDTTVMGAGMGPLGHEAMPMNYTQNRATLHLHGGRTPWISDGTPHQWITPDGEMTPYAKGVSVQNVPDMPDPGPGALTFYWSNQQSARMMFFHDHSYGITRLNVYVGEAAGYLLTDDVEKALVSSGAIPTEQIPLIIQDKTFVDAATIGTTDPLWAWGTMPGMPMTGDLWLPHVYMPAQNPGDLSGINAFGRWHYGPWFWPPTTNIANGPIPNPYFGQPGEPEKIPGVPHPSMGMEAFFDTPLVNGTAFPTLTVEPKAYRFRILNAANDRFWNLQLYEADPNVTASDGRTLTEVKMVPAVQTAGYPDGWPTDGRAGDVPDPATRGPSFIQIASEGGFLPAPAVIPNQPITWNMDPTTFNFGNVQDHALLLGPAERADVIIDFSAYAGKTLILYNDAPAAFPALDPRYDYYTGAPDLTETGGHWGPQIGFGPNTRTIMQITVSAGTGTPFNLDALNAAFTSTADAPGAFAASQDPIIMPHAGYNTAYNASFPVDVFARIHDFSKTFLTVAGTTVTLPFQPKAIQDEMGEAFEHEYGRMSGNLGVELPATNAGNQNFVLLPYIDPPTEVLTDCMTPMAPVAGDGTQIWKITHNGVDTHPIHFHLFDVQLINRVGWDGGIRPPDANELGWKDTVRISPLEDTIVALRPVAPKQPFGIPDSIRFLDPTMPPDSTMGFSGLDPLTGQPRNPPVTNVMFNFGWEYMWHCHILSHEEMDMMRPITVAGARALPPAPVVTLEQAIGAINVTWIDGTPAADPATLGNPAGEIGFRIERADVSADSTNGPYAAVGAALANATSFADTSAFIGAWYRYRVVAYNAAGETPSAPVDIGGPIPTPAAPTNLTATLQGAQIQLAWTDNANNETGFVLERSVNGGAFAQLATPAVDAQAYVDAVSPGNTYVYQVKAVNANVSSAYAVSNPVTVSFPPPAAPTNLAATLQGGLQISLTWVDNATDETGFVLERSVNGGAFAQFATPTPDAQAYLDTAVVAGNTYAYQVKAVNANGSSAYAVSAPVAVPNVPPPAAPINLAASWQAGQPVNLTWRDRSNNETNFVIERSVNGGAFTQLAQTAAGQRSYADTTAAGGNSYAYRVKAVNLGGSSAYTSTVTVTAPTLPAAPSNLTASARRNGNNARITLNWTDNANNETGFTVQYSTDANFAAGVTTQNVAANAVTSQSGNLQRNRTYWCRIRAVNAAGPSGWSNVASVTTP